MLACARTHSSQRVCVFCMTLTMHTHHLPIQHPTIGPSDGSRLLCVRTKLHLSHINDARRLILILTGLMKSLFPEECSTFLGNVCVCNRFPRITFYKAVLFKNKHTLKNRKPTPVTCRVAENGRFQEICIFSCLLTDDIRNVNSFTRRAAKVRPLDVLPHAIRDPPKEL